MSVVDQYTRFPNGIDIGPDGSPVLLFSGAGPPTDGTAGTAVGFASPSSIYLDATNGQMYLNRGTAASPQWAAASAATIETQLTNAQLLALRATPINLVAAPGAGLAIVPLDLYLVLDAAAGAYTETADNLTLEYATGADIYTDIETTGWFDVAAVAPRFVRPAHTPAAPLIPVTNSAVRLLNGGDGEWGGGNAANTLSARLRYRVEPVAAFV